MARLNHRQDHRLREAFFEEGKRLDADPDTRGESVCWICRGRIDYIAKPGTTPDSHNLDHRHPVSTHPELQRDPGNFRHSHTSCNQHRGNSAPSAGLGESLPDWWT